MQAIALALASTLILTQTPAGPRKSDREKARLVGNVRSVLLEVAPLREEGGNLVEGKRLGIVTRYDEKGYLTEQLYVYDGRIDGRTVYTYDPDGNFTKRMYAARGHTIGPQENDATQPKIFKVKVKHDPEGNLIEEATHDSNGKLVNIALYKYDKQNNKVEVTEKAADGTVKSICTKTYGEREQEIEQVCQRLNFPSSEHKYKYVFDTTSNWTKRYQTITSIKDGKRIRSNRAVNYLTISYDASKDVYPDDGSTGGVPLPGRPMVIRENGATLVKKATKRVMPSYSRETSVGGTAVVEIRIDTKGKVIKAEAVSGPAEFRKAAVDAAKQWEFTPTTSSGQPVEVIGRLTFIWERLR